MKKLITFILILFLTGCLTTTSMTKNEIEMEVGYSITHIIDWGQTRAISESSKFVELNPILGKHPTLSAINNYMAGTLVAHWLITYLLPEEWREEFQITTLVLEGVVILWNYSLGVGILL